MSKGKDIMFCVADIDTRGQFCQSTLHAAVKSNSITEVELLLQSGVDINATNEREMTPLHVAVKEDLIEIVQLLLNSGVNVKAADCNRETALHYAVEENSIQLVKLLLQHGADASATNEWGMTPLHQAVRQNMSEIVELLLNHGSNVHVRDCNGYYLLNHAVQENAVEMVKLLLRYGANINAADRRDNLLLTSVYRNYREVARVLLDSGANIEATWLDGDTPLYYSITRNCLEWVKLLLQHGANVNTVHRRDQLSPLNHALRKGCCIEVVKTLLQHGADVNAVHKRDHLSPLQHALRRGSVEVVRTLLQHGADVDEGYHKGMSPLIYCIKENDVRLTQLLLDYGASVNVRSLYSGNTALHFAIFASYDLANLQCIKVLFRNGANINVKNNEGYTAIKCAVLVQRFDIIEELIRQHMLKAPHVSISEEDLRIIWNCEEMWEFDSECEREIEIMRETKIGSSTVTYYDMLTKNKEQLVKYAANASIIQQLENDEYEDKFPIYCDIINTNFVEAQARQSLMISSLSCFHYLLQCLSEISLPDIFINKVFNYLSDEDLHNVMKSCSDVGI